MSSDQVSSDSPPPQAGRTPQRRQAVPRRSAVTLVDADDPLSAQSSAQSSPSKTPSRQSLASDRRPVSSPLRAESRSPVPPVTVVERPKKDFGFLLRRDNFHTLNDNNIPAPFRDSELYTIAPETSLQTLLSTGRFQAAATLSATQLTSVSDPTDHTTIFSLLFTRLASLQLCNRHDIAAQESKALQDLNAPFYIDRVTGKHLIPWELRVLAVRLQAIGFSDWRRGIMGYYELAREARVEFRRVATNDSSEQQTRSERDQKKQIWRERLHDLGIRVANALLEMGDDEGAIRHLKTLSDAGSPTAKTRLGLVYLRAGDVTAAKDCIIQSSDATAASEGDDRGEKDDSLDSRSSLDMRILAALCKMADGSFQEAIIDWENLRRDILAEAAPDDYNETISEENDAFAQIATQNLAVCLLFTGDIQQARSLLESQIDKATEKERKVQGFEEQERDNSKEEGKGSEDEAARAINHIMTFNLATIYELCSDQNRTLKLQLANKLAARKMSSTGWEFFNADFKL